MVPSNLIVIGEQASQSFQMEPVGLGGARKKAFYRVWPFLLFYMEYINHIDLLAFLLFLDFLPTTIDFVYKSRQKIFSFY